MKLVASSPTKQLFRQRLVPVMQNLELRFVSDDFRQFKLVFKWREKGVTALNFPFDKREIKIGTARQSLLIDLPATADEDVIWKLLRIKPVQRAENKNLRLHLFAQL